MFYKRKNKLVYYSYQEKMHLRMFKSIEIQSDPKTFVQIEVIFDIDAISKLNIYADKERINFKRRKRLLKLYISNLLTKRFKY